MNRAVLCTGAVVHTLANIMIQNSGLNVLNRSGFMCIGAASYVVFYVVFFACNKFVTGLHCLATRSGMEQLLLVLVWYVPCQFFC